MKFILHLLIAVTLLCNCTKNPTDRDKLYTVSGNLFIQNKPEKDIEVSIDGLLNLTTYTDQEGYFRISDVTQGEHNILMNKQFENGSSISKSSQIEVNADVYLESLKLPKPVFMFTPINITSETVSLRWSKTDAIDFREYKLYRHHSSGLDENTGELIHISTSISDTTFTDDNLVEMTTYFYRIYMMNEYGKLGGSNIVSCTTMEKNLIKNGDFELVENGLPTDWNLRNDVFKPVKSDSAQSGQYYLFGDATKYIYDLSWGSLEQRIPYTELESGIQYQLSFWYYIEDFAGNSALMVQFNPEQEMFIRDQIDGPSSTDWKYFLVNFTAPQNMTKDYFLRFLVNVNIPYDSEPWKIRLDNVVLKRK